MKACHQCGVVKGPDEFSLGSNGKPQRRCRECLNANNRARDPVAKRAVYNAWYARNKERMHDRRNEGQRRRYAKDSTRLEYAKAYAKAHPENAVILSARKRAGVRAADGGIDAKLWIRLKASQMGRCIYCRETCKITLDHVLAVSLGGDNELTNIVGCCKRCNDQKNSLPLETFMSKYNVSRVTFLADRGASLFRLRTGQV